VSVAENGIGIPAADVVHVFDKFYLVKDHKKLAPGTGLGLNLVKQIIETVHGGKVGVESSAGKGSTFTFSLPMADSQY
jgi:signal transduction histidine kinase